ncbi:hypothetical protein [Salinimicrobium sp. HB62]|uniref:hypothetical protein n=1 Tax=Salinimicrobium sp. HB62 TaxID=3077781 RepID=UPI002D7A0EBE|nr:hypothetical protein [Salinimicrobium sp. HB62]
MIWIKLDKVRVLGLAVLVSSLILDYFLEPGMYGFWIGASAGAGGVFTVFGNILKKR